MRILQIATAFPKGRPNIYTDLALALKRAGHDIVVVALDSSVENDEMPNKEDKYPVFRLKTPRLTQISKYKKGINFLILPYVAKSKIKKIFSSEKFDLVLFEAPPITIYPIIKWAVKYFKCPSFLMQKDIFPQNAVDLGFFKKNSLPYFYFRWIEKNLLKIATKIGCISPANIKFLINENPDIDKSKYLYFPNSKYLTKEEDSDKIAFRRKYGFDDDACVFLFSGNLGVPQHVSFLCDAMQRFESYKGINFIVIGNGTERNYVKRRLEKDCPKNSRFLDFLPYDEYNKLAVNCDVGMISLDPRYTIPNFPSKVLSYTENAMPIVAATDTVTDLRQFLEDDAKCGLWANSSNLDDFCKNIERLANDPILRETLGKNGLEYAKKHFSVIESVKTIESIFQK